MNAPNYKETTVTGTSWQRVCRFIGENPLGGTPTLMFVEEEVLQKADGKTSSEIVANLHVTFSQDNPLHTEVYRILNLIYEEERAKRDAEVANG